MMTLLVMILVAVMTGSWLWVIIAGIIWEIVTVVIFGD